MSFELLLNQAQRRLAADRLTVVAGGLELNGSVWENTWIDPVTNTLMLRPRPLETEWYTTATGEYAKLGLADFAVGSEWEERIDQHWAGPWLAARDAASNPAALSNVSFPKNLGLSFSWFSYGAGDTFLQYQLGWNDVASDAAGVALHFWSDGRVEVFRNGAFVDEGKISGAKSREVRRLQVYEVMVIPMRGRELLVVAQSGDGFSVVFGDIDPDDPEPEITPAGKIWFRCVSGATQAQIAPLRFAQSGFATSLKSAFLEAPVAGESLVEFENATWLGGVQHYLIYGDPGYGAGDQSVEATLVKWDGVTEFIPDGTANEIRVRLDLTSTDSRFSPFVTGVQLGFGAISDLTDGSGVGDGAEFVGRAVLSVPDRAFGVASDLLVTDGDGIDALSGGQLGRGSSPVRLVVDDQTVLEGIAGAMERIAENNSVTEGKLEIRDRWGLIDDAIFADRVPLDGLSFSQAVRLLVEKSGIEGSRVRVSESGLSLPFAPGLVAGEWGLLIEAGDRVSDWLKRLFDTFAPGWWYGFRPAADGSGEEFFAVPESELSAESAGVLFRSVSEGIVYRHLRRAALEPVANEVRVTGVDPRTGRPMQSVRTDYGAQTVGASVATRSATWSGSIKRYALVDRGLTKQSAVDASCDALFADLAKMRELVEFESEMLFHDSGGPIWRGDLVTLDRVGDVRIRSLGVDFRFEVDGGTYRKAVYCGELVG
ncbi:hypothetical protein C0431_00105 [bacterium]|nr:hypothetical protein [bacterium]